MTKCRHLSLIEELAYRRMLDAYYTEECPLPPDFAAVARLLVMRGHEAEITSVLQEFFMLANDGWHNARADAEIAAYKAKAAKCRDASAARWSRTAVVAAVQTDSQSTASALQPHSEGKANAKRTVSQAEPELQPQPQLQPQLQHDLQLPSKKQQRAESARAFAEFWNHYPRKAAKDVAMASWDKLDLTPALLNDIMAGLKSARLSDQWMKDAGKFVPMPATWLNQRRWTDEHAPEQADSFAGVL